MYSFLTDVLFKLVNNLTKWAMKSYYSHVHSSRHFNFWTANSEFWVRIFVKMALILFRFSVVSKSYDISFFQFFSMFNCRCFEFWDGAPTSGQPFTKNVHSVMSNWYRFITNWRSLLWNSSAKSKTCRTPLFPGKTTEIMPYF